MIVRAIISFPWIVLSYSNDYEREFALPYSYIFTILWCGCGPGSCFRGGVVGYGFLEKDPASVTITQFWFLLVNHPILQRISMTDGLMIWKQGWIYVQGWMWFQCSMEHLLRHFTWQCGYFILLLGLLSSEIMCCGVLLLWCCGLVFESNLVFIKCPDTQSDGIVGVLDSMGRIYTELDAMHQEWLQVISQEASKCSLKYEVSDILDEFWTSSPWDIWRSVIPSRRWSHLS